MLRDITLGQFYPIDSILHRLDPRVKIICTFIYMISVFLVRDVWGYLAATLFLAIMIIISKVPFKYMIRGLKGILMIMILTAVINVFTTPGKVLLSIGVIDITLEGIKVAVRMVLRLIFLVMGSSIMMLTTTPSRLTYGLERIFKPLERFNLPVHEIAMMISIALGFIPILVDELDKIIKAQSVRGVDFNNRKLSVRIKNMIPVLVPLFVSAFRRAGDLAVAMEARCYHGGGKRTGINPLRYDRRDHIAYLVIFIYLSMIIVIGIIF
ncbi:MAG: energy-coupling factor transporter transmembrane protein EcfT [Lachnospiraceae bacterium]|nr:energy-coupling factor transporter transmembrane protein EcfT [Lachnospiraceae bacterium]